MAAKRVGLAWDGGALSGYVQAIGWALALDAQQLGRPVDSWCD